MYININPKEAINYSLKKTLSVLSSLIGKDVMSQAFDIETHYPSPAQIYSDSNWLKKSKIIGINPRIIGSYFNIVKYAMTFPEDAIHIMPIWEMGCDGGIYARVNWKLSGQWLDRELVEFGYDTPEKQLKLVINLLHALGKKVGFDCVPHTDKFSEEVFIVPECFEWIRLNEDKTFQMKYSDSEEIYPQIREYILEFLNKFDCADGSKFGEQNFYSLAYEERVKILFGNTLEQRTSRRVALMDYLRELGFETIPVTEHSPCRPIKFDCIKNNEFGSYADFKIENKNASAKIFNSITPYRWYKIDENGYPDIDKPIQETFEYFYGQVEKFQKDYNFDFFRADMAHNQISHSHCNDEKNDKFDAEMWKLLKEKIQINTPYFATFAESFLGNYYISGISDMINKNFDAILGFSNFRYLDSEFVELLKYYHNCSECFSFAPSVVSITNDSDQEHNNKFHQSPMANEIRYFVQMFLTLPGYTGMGFECRNLLPEDDSEYSGIYTNYRPKNYTWGSNKNLFNAISKIRKMYSKIDMMNLKTYILPIQSENVLAWLLCDVKNNNPKYFCLVNIDATCEQKDIFYDSQIHHSLENKVLKPIFSLYKSKMFIKSQNADLGCIQNVDFGESIIYEIIDKKSKKKTNKNKKQILLVSTEYNPYAKSGGLADYCADFAKNYNEKYDADVRVILPLYNSDKASFEDSNSYIELFDKYENNKPIRFEIVDTKIETQYTYGIYESCAKLYKIKNPINGVPVYLVYSSAFSNIKKEYTGDNFETSAAYTSATVALLKGLAKKEGFNPAIVQVNDHLTANCILLIKELSKFDEFYRGIKTVYAVHSIFDESKIPVTLAFLKYFAKSQIEKLCVNKQIKELVDKIKLSSNFELLQELNLLLCNELKNIVDDEKYNIVKQTVYLCDKWITVSKYMYDMLIKNEYDILGSTYFKYNKEKGCGALIGINNEIYDPQNVIKYPFDLGNYQEQKKQNKLFLQNEFSKENIMSGNVSKDLLSSNDGVTILGSLYKDENSVLMLNITRPDKIKGIDVIKSILPNMEKEYPNTQLVLIGVGLIKDNESFWQTPQIESLFDAGRLLVIDSFVDIRQYLASVDMFLMPSYMETCGLVVMQAMRYGTIPVANNTGCVSKVIQSLKEDLQNANGFKVDKILSVFQNLEDDYKKVLSEALDVFNQRNQWNLMIKNAMSSDWSWSSETLSEYKQIFDEELANE